MYEAAIGECVRRLRSRKQVTFGRRPCGTYVKANHGEFVRAVASLDSVGALLLPVRGELAHLDADAQQRLTRIVERVDMHWVVVHGLDERCLETWRNRLRDWVRQTYPWLTDLDGLSEVVSARCRSYTYEEDLITWLLPAARRWALAQSVDTFRRSHRFDLEDLIARLTTAVQQRAGLVPGITIDAAEVVSRAVLQTLVVNPRELYDLSISEPALRGWTARLVSEEISWCLARWDASMDDPALARMLLSEFKDLADAASGARRRTVRAQPQAAPGAGAELDAEGDVSQHEPSFGDLGRTLRAFESALPGLDLSLTARYGSVRAGRRVLNELEVRVIETVVAEGGSPKHIRRQARRLLLGALLANGVRLGAVARRSLAVDRLDRRMAVCLWLAGDRSSSKGISGLWGRFLSLLDVDIDDRREKDDMALPRDPIPPFLVELFGPPESDDGEQSYIQAATITLLAHQAMARRRRPLNLPVSIPAAHRQLARWLDEASFGKRAGTGDGAKKLLSALGRAFDSELDGGERTASQLLQASAGASRGNGVDAARLLTWVVGTCLENKPPIVVLREVESEKRNHVHVDLARARFTLAYKLAMRVNSQFGFEQSHEPI